LDPDTLADEQRQLLVHGVTMLAPLRDKSWTLAVLDESKGDADRPVAEILQVTAKDGRAVKLDFHKGSHFLVRSECLVRDPRLNRQVLQEVVYSDYRETQGIKRPRKVIVKRAGQPFLEIDITDDQLLEKLDDKTFARP